MAARLSPSDRRRPRARPGGTSRIAQTTSDGNCGRGVCRRRRTPCRSRCRDSRRSKRRCCPRWSSASFKPLIMPSCTGCTKPMASRTRSASTSELRCLERASSLSSTCTQWSFFHIAVGAREVRGHHRRSRGARAPSSWLDEVRNWRPVRPGQLLVLVQQRRCRQDLEIGHAERALPDRACRYSRNRCVTAADDHDMLAVGEDRLGLGRRLAGDATILLRQRSPWRSARP